MILNERECPSCTETKEYIHFNKAGHGWKDPIGERRQNLCRECDQKRALLFIEMSDTVDGKVITPKNSNHSYHKAYLKGGYKEVCLVMEIETDIKIKDEITTPKVELPDIIKEVSERNKADIANFNSKTSKTKEGFVYVISNSAWQGVVKIGCAINPIDRCSSFQTCDPNRAFTIEAYFYSEDRQKLEYNIHKHLSKHRGNGEWFSLLPKVAVRRIKEFLDAQ